MPLNQGIMWNILKDIVCLGEVGIQMYVFGELKQPLYSPAEIRCLYLVARKTEMSDVSI